jgi:alanyl-tRNA synthetase
LSESSIGSGTRRIEAITGSGILEPLVRAEDILGEVGKLLKAEPDMIKGRVGEVLDEMKTIRRELDDIKKGALGSRVDSLIAGAVPVGEGSGKLVTGSFDGLSADELRGLADDIRGAEKDVIAALASVTGGKVLFIVAVSDSMQQSGYRAGDIVKAMAQAAGGGGGGKADMAQAGAKDPSKVDEAFAAAAAFLSA